MFSLIIRFGRSSESGTVVLETFGLWVVVLVFGVCWPANLAGDFASSFIRFCASKLRLLLRISLE
jgi:hypothetical protein